MKGGKNSTKKKKDSLTVKGKNGKNAEIPSEVVSDRPRITTVGKREVLWRITRGFLSFPMRLSESIQTTE